jgi:N6-adenosine-specific RNA methylase IME4
MKTPACRHCGLVDATCCESAEDARDCPHAPGAVIQSGPLAGLKRWHYGVIYADPPWSFKTFSNPVDGIVPHRSEVKPYESMTREELLALPVADITRKDCVLHMWTISSHQDQAYELAAAWGFTYKSLGFNWVKTQKGDPETPKMGMGMWLRQESEISLLFTKGKPKRVGAGVRQVLLEPAREHSRKPDGFYDRIEELSAGPYAELFSRSSREGWDAMGNEVGKFDKRPLALPPPEEDWGEDLV